jgi:hypothetical protein
MEGEVVLNTTLAGNPLLDPGDTIFDGPSGCEYMIAVGNSTPLERRWRLVFV